jgi:hypothetical protein
VVLAEDTGKRWARPRRRERGQAKSTPGSADDHSLVGVTVGGNTARFLLCALPPLISTSFSVHKHAQQLHASALIPLFVRLRYSHALCLGLALAEPAPAQLDTLDVTVFELHRPAHDDDGDSEIALSLPAAASPLPSRSATPAAHRAWGAEGLSDRLRTEATIAFVDMFSLGALDVAF